MTIHVPALMKLTDNEALDRIADLMQHTPAGEDYDMNEVATLVRFTGRQVDKGDLDAEGDA